ncbi:thiamine phosphate synthase [Parapusillimonas granuli]|uniref:Thiamine-phosphate synthase n=1 Tax=Parapusillimonas granuli TaxID=380911 RepID=A0A853G484_9BURK|nr:thiamine phosphate synthase [Parapusillimonas granuli]MBB5215816.1 thiamine-phosphate pyrophosphorylase [Parapusillimonas granuli]NYT51119.1 thiamine phosphate synthase [Parapusillimonas granuli]
MNTELRFPRGLYGITPEWDDTDRLLEGIGAAARGGMAALQWRRKTIAPGDRVAQARRVAELCRRLGLPCIINDDWRLAALVDADGVHLGKEDGSIVQARLALGPEKIIGCSCYDDPALAEKALQADVDYVAFGAVYPSTVKPQAVKATLDHIRQGRRLVEGGPARPRPAIVAIGGITADNAAPVILAGADSIAVISGLFGTPDIQAAASRCSALFG